jgi:hypothetical protein
VTNDLPAVDLPADVAGLITALRAAQTAKAKILEQTAPYDEMIAALTERIQQALGDAEVGRIDGRDVVTWKRSSRFDSDAFLAQTDPEIAAAFTKPTVDVAWLKRQRPDLHWHFSFRSDSRRFSLVDGE